MPVIGDIKGFVEAESALDYLVAAIAIIPGAGDAAGKTIKAAEKALVKSDVAEASRLINKASDEVNTAKYFGQERKYWSANPIEFQGNKVYQRNDIFDLKYIDPKSGKTNVELMSSGRAPIGTDGKPVNLHHMLQKQDGATAEITQSFHKENHGVIHINDNSIPSGINRAEFNKWRISYWKDRAKSYK
ncbi:HNH/ENDO VII family nuclease [Photorhabdus sp. RM323S]|uniref:HNH/ENDO VII family nuclease n=1 Tax=Photorhabdus sp. RM323S TaxID=3342828 RepID=UPI0036DA7785